jgi:hypothetical protein
MPIHLAITVPKSIIVFNLFIYRVLRIVCGIDQNLKFYVIVVK